MTNELLEDAVLKRAEWIDTILVSGVLLCITLSLLRHRKKKNFELLNVELPIAFFPWVCVAYTTAHLYATWLFTQICFSAGVGHSDAWQALTQKGPLVFAGMLPRIVTFRLSLPLGASVPFTRISLGDPTTWLFYGFCFCLFFAFTNAAHLARYSEAKRLVLVAFLLVLNWTAGSVWSYAASTLNQSPQHLTMRHSEPGVSVAVAIVASRGSGR